MSEIKIGTAVVVNDGEGRVLLGKRLSKHAHGCYGFPGGHVDFGEHPERTALRELMEETGLNAQQASLVGVASKVYEEEGKHYITLFYRVDQWEGTPQNIEPEKCEGWEWYEPAQLPSPMMEDIPPTVFLR